MKGIGTIIKQFGAYMLNRKAWWLLPILVMLAVVGALIIVGQSSVISPFVYSLF